MQDDSVPSDIFVKRASFHWQMPLVITKFLLFNKTNYTKVGLFVKLKNSIFIKSKYTNIFKMPIYLLFNKPNYTMIFTMTKNLSFNKTNYTKVFTIPNNMLLNKTND